MILRDRFFINGQWTNPSSKETIERITWTPNADGTVRQHWQQSTDGGATWSVIDMAPHAGMILDVKFFDENTGLVFAATNADAAQAEGLVLRTEDGGKTWKEVSADPFKSCMNGVTGEAEPFELHRRQDGRLTLLDPKTGMRLDIESFGPQHAASFVRLMRTPTP